jgi:hypothetical protein
MLTDRTRPRRITWLSDRLAITSQPQGIEQVLLGWFH